MTGNTTSFEIVKDCTKWTVRKGHEDLLDYIDLDNLRSSLNGRPFDIIKETNVRSVISIPGTNNAGIYIKIFKRKSYRESIKYLFSPTKTKTEWSIGNELLRKGINTAQPLALAEKRTGILLEGSLLVTKAVTNSRPFMDYCKSVFSGLLSEERSNEKKDLLIGLANFVRKVHDAGFFHNDLHTGNLLIKFNDDNLKLSQGYSLYLMDLHHAKLLKRLSVQKRLFNLAQIFNSLVEILSNSEKLDFVNSYGTDAFNGTINNQEIVNRIDSIASKIRDVHFRSRLKRCLKESTNFSKKKISGLTIYSRKGHDVNGFLKAIEKHHHALNSKDKSAIIKSDTKTALTRTPFENGNIKNVVVKNYKSKCVICILKNAFRCPPGRRAWKAGNGLLEYSFSAAKPLALIEKKIMGLVSGSYLIMEDVDGCLEMDRYILKNFQGPLPSERLVKKKTFINDYAKAIGEMHKQKIFHSDLKTCNVLVNEKDKGHFDFTFLDYDNVIFGEDINLQQIVKNLTQINLSTPRSFTYTDRFRFLKEYLEHCNLTDEKRAIAGGIINRSKTEKILYVSFKGDVTEDW